MFYLPTSGGQNLALGISLTYIHATLNQARIIDTPLYLT